MPTIWRLHTKPEAEDVDPGAFCIEKGILGIGWPVEPDVDLMDWDTYHSRGIEEYYNKGEKG